MAGKQLHQNQNLVDEDGRLRFRAREHSSRGQRRPRGGEFREKERFREGDEQVVPEKKQQEVQALDNDERHYAEMMSRTQMQKQGNNHVSTSQNVYQGMRSEECGRLYCF